MTTSPGRRQVKVARTVAAKQPAEFNTGVWTLRPQSQGSAEPAKDCDLDSIDTQKPQVVGQQCGSSG